MRILPRDSHPRVDATLILPPTPRESANVLSSLILVDTLNTPFTVSGASTIFQITSLSDVPSGYTLSTVASA